MPATPSPWDNGEEITAEERCVLLNMDSDEERARVMNLRRRDRGLLESGEISKVLPILAKPDYSDLKAAAAKGKGRKKAKGNVEDGNKEHVDASSGQRRSSSRHQKPKAPAPTSTSIIKPSSRLAVETVSPSPAAPNTPDASEENWPEWMEEAVPQLRGMSDSAQWLSLVSQWIHLEAELEYPTSRVSSK